VPPSNDELITSLPRIRRYSRHNEAENARFADFVKFKLNLSNQELDKTVQETADSVFDKINCLDCGNCCHSPQIEVDEKDAQRIANRIGISLKEFKSKYLVKINKIQQFISAPCPFLGEDNACKVYEDRPSACRAFPYLHEGNFRSRVYVTLENVAACPIAFNVWQELKTKLGEKSKK
jgi:uncharacterized protein